MAISQKILDIRAKRGIQTPGVTSGTAAIKSVAVPTPTASVSTPSVSSPSTKKIGLTPVVDTFGATSGKSILGQTVTPGARLSTGQTITKETAKVQDLGELNKRGQDAINAGKTSPGFIVNRNNQVVQNLLADGVTDQAGIKNYLEKQAGFTTATPEQQANTLRTLTEMMGTQTSNAMPTAQSIAPEQQKQPQYDLEGNIMAKNQADIVEQYNKEKQYMEDQNKRRLQIQDLQGNTIEIQSSQRLQQAQKQVDDLKQRTAYLGTMGQPGVSAGQLGAVQKQITDAETTFGQLKQMEQNAAQMRALGIEFDAAAFEKQMSDMTDKLHTQVTQAVQDKINQINTLSAGGKIDTMEELNQIKGTMMQELDKSIANIAISNQSERQLILDRYNKVIQQGAEMTKNANTVNQEMSQVLGHYVDGNGHAILGANGLPVPVQPKAPFPPQFDKDTGMLITFKQGANGEIVATPQKIMDVAQKQNPRQKGEDGTFYRTGANGQLEFAQSPGSSVQASYSGPSVPPADPQKLEQAYAKFTSIKDGDQVRGGQCAEFVNDYVKEATGISNNLFIDPIDIRATQTNSQEPSIGSVVVMKSSGTPEATKYGHVAIVTGVNPDGTITIKEQNGSVKGKVSTRNIGTENVVGYFDLSKGLEGKTAKSSSYDPSMLSLYTKYIESGQRPTEKQIAQLGGIEKFSADASKAYLDVQNRVLKAQNMKLTDPEFYVSMSPDERKEFAKDTKTVKNVISKVDSIIKKVQDSGLPRQTLVGKGGELKGAITDLQMQMKGEGAYALGVLSGPDLSLLESVIPSPDLINKVGGESQFIDRLVQARNMFTDQINTSNSGLGVEFTPPPAPVKSTNNSEQTKTGQTKPTPQEVSNKLSKYKNKYL